MELDHVTIRTRDLQATRNFFQTVFDLKEGERPLAIHLIPGHWLYSEDHLLVHIIGSQGSGHDRLAEAIDHVGLRMQGYPEFRNKLDQLGIDYSTMDLVDLGGSGGCSFTRPADHCWKPSFPNPFLRTTELGRSPGRVNHNVARLDECGHLGVRPHRAGNLISAVTANYTLLFISRVIAGLTQEPFLKV
jgi:catechol 2,3-dioxygenase-like lactoylglutathione lyase family enzyme